MSKEVKQNRREKVGRFSVLFLWIREEKSDKILYNHLDLL